MGEFDFKYADHSSLTAQKDEIHSVIIYGAEGKLEVRLIKSGIISVFVLPLSEWNSETVYDYLDAVSLKRAPEVEFPPEVFERLKSLGETGGSPNIAYPEDDDL